ncbi:MAG: hypothetical protein ACREEP_06815 [Dongiaceae bacterium]
MSLFRRILRPACCILIGTLLFAQAAFAMRPCVDPGMSAAAAISAQSGNGCCETNIAEINLCALQCGDSHKLPGPAYLLTLPTPAATGFAVLQPSQDHGAMTWLRLQRDLVADPPPTLRFCCFLI